jgi:Fe(3+) dicitrate transport protein
MIRFLAPLLALSVLSPAIAQDVLAPVEVRAKQYAPVRWKEVESTRILSGKKNKATKTDVNPPIATDNLRQFFSQNAAVLTPEQSTEPWAAISIRGIGDPHEAQNVLVLQDGLPVPVDMYGRSGVYYAPPGPLMDEIEVIGGGAALMFGPQPAGAINFRSKALTPATEFGGKVGLTYGSYDLRSTVNQIHGKAGNTAYWAGYYGKSGNGYQRTNADFFAHNLQAKTHTFLENGGIVKFSVQGYDSEFGMPGGMARLNCNAANANCWDRDGDNRRATRENDRLKIARALLSVGYEKKVSDATTIEATVWTTAYKRYSNTQTGTSFGIKPTADTNTSRQTDAYGFNTEVRARHDWKAGDNENTLTAGVLSYNTNSPLTEWSGAKADSIRGVVTNRTQNETRAQALFVENRFAFGKLAIIPGVRLEHIELSSENRTLEREREEKFDVVLGGLGASYDLTEVTQAYANVSQGFKPISFATVLQQADPTVVVEGDIKPSYIYNYEAGVRSDSAKWNWDVSGYWVQYQNQLASTNSGGITTLFNGRSAHYRGIEAGVTRKDVLAHDQHALDLYVNGNLLDAEFRGGELEGNSPMFSPRHMVKYGAIYRYAEKYRASLLATYVSDYYANDTHTQNNYVPSYQLFDLLGEARFGKNWSVNGAVNNFLDKVYYARVQSTGVLPTMGRNFYAGASYRF